MSDFKIARKQSWQKALALRPLLNESPMKSRWTSQALAVGLWLGSEAAPKSGVTSLAGFAAGGDPKRRVDARPRPRL